MVEDAVPREKKTMSIRRLWPASAALLLGTARAFEPQAVFKLVQQPFSFLGNKTSIADANMTRGAVVSVTHGGGPMPLLGDPGHTEIVRSLQQRVPEILNLDSSSSRPRAIVLVTAHWSERHPTVSSGPKPELLYDYYGFPPEAYEFKYPAAGGPEVAQEVYAALQEGGFSPQLDGERGWDHGVFVPMALIRPQADIPVVQLSVLASEDPGEHFRMGRALLKLRDSNVAIVGSGSASFHNLRLIFSGATGDPKFKDRNRAWSAAVADAVLERDEGLRAKKLATWRRFPAAHEMHPRGGAEHMMPLLVCAGAGGDGTAGSYSDEFLALDMYSFYWK